MERYINSFATENDIQIALENGELLKPYVAYIEDVDRIDWNSKELGPITRYLTFEIVSAGTINLFTPYDYLKIDIQYKVNNNDWQTAQFKGANGRTIGNFNPGDVIQFKGNNDSYGFFKNVTNVGNSFIGTASFKISGNIMSLIYGDNFLGKNYFPEKSDRNFTGMFKGSKIADLTGLVLPATTLTDCCYYEMFYNCTSLTAVPSNLLPATTLAQDCYQNMFQGCTSLTTAPALPATTLVKSCYQNMFDGCTSLNYIKCLATDISATNCTKGWVSGVAKTGTFVKASSMTSWTTGVSGIPTGWTVQDA